MKDLLLKKESDGSVVGTLRCEMLSNTPSNIEPVEIKNDQGKIVDHLLVGKQIIQKVAISFPTFIGKCTADGIKVVSSETNGKTPTNLN